AGDDQQGGPDEAVEDGVAQGRFVGEGDGGQAEDEDAVAAEVTGNGLEVDPAEYEREGDGGGEKAAPHDEQVGEAARAAAAGDEEVEEEDAGQPGEEVDEGLAEVAGPEECLPAAPPVEAGGRPLEPHGVAVGDGEGGEQTGEGVADQGGVDVAEVARAGEDE